MKWILQDKNFALGNFINITPVIYRLYKEQNRKVDVFFETDYVKECYVNSPYINIITDKPNTPPFCASSIVNRKNNLPDYQYVYQYIYGEEYTEEYKPFIDKYDDIYEYGSKYIVILNGSGSSNKDYVNSKNPDIKYYINEIEDKLKEGNYFLVFTGSNEDKERLQYLINYYSNEDLIEDFGCIKSSLRYIQHAEYVIGNDTGLIHAAGCYDKPMSVIWKDTKKIKNKNSGKYVKYIYTTNYE